MAHAINGYPGACRNIHGHSYELHVTTAGNTSCKGHIPAPGFITDFKVIKQIVTTAIIEKLDHKLILSEDFLQKHPSYKTQENLVPWKAEPTAENMLLYIEQTLSKILPAEIKLVYLKLFETKDSYAEWVADNTFDQY